jgi:hypothetical protein
MSSGNVSMLDCWAGNPGGERITSAEEVLEPGVRSSKPRE